MSKINELSLKPNDNIMLTTGLGLSDKGVPLRLPSLIMPGLEMLREFKEAGLKVTYSIYQATGFIINTNKLKRRQAKAASRYSEYYLTQFVETFYPDIADLVKFSFGDQCKIDETQISSVQTIIYNNIDSQCPALNTIKNYGKGHRGNAMRYAAANVMMNKGITNYYPLEDFTTKQTTVVIPIGGKKEKPFFTLTKHIAKTTGCKNDIRPIIVNTGTIPAYYPCPDGDLIAGVKDENIHAFTPSQKIKNDYKILRSIAPLTELNKMAIPPNKPHPTSPKILKKGLAA